MLCLGRVLCLLALSTGRLSSEVQWCVGMLVVRGTLLVEWYSFELWFRSTARLRNYLWMASDDIDHSNGACDVGMLSGPGHWTTFPSDVSVYAHQYTLVYAYSVLQLLCPLQRVTVLLNIDWRSNALRRTNFCTDLRMFSRFSPHFLVPAGRAVMSHWVGN